MKRFVILLMVFIVQLGFAQGKIKLKSGQVINGKILDTIDSRTVLIEFEDGKQSIINRNQISRSNFDTLPPHKMKYVFLAELGRYNHNYGHFGYRFNITQGVELNRYFLGGINLGYRSEQTILGFNSALSVATDFRLYLTSGNIRPYFGLGLGAIIYMNEFVFFNSNEIRESRTSFLFNPSFGTSLKINERLILNTAVGFEMDALLRYFYFNVGVGHKL